MAGGPGTLAYARQQLEGTWTLSKLEVLNAAGQMQALRAKVQLTNDAARPSSTPSATSWCCRASRRR